MLDRLNYELAFNQNALNLHSYRQEQLASNIANIDTPQYKPSDLSFSKKFKHVLETKTNNQNSNNPINTNKQQLTKSHNLTNVNNNNSKNTTNNFVSKNKAVNIDLERVNFVHNGLKYQADIVFINNKIRNIMNVLHG